MLYVYFLLARELPLRILAFVIIGCLVMKTTLNTHLCQVCSCLSNVFGPPYISASCKIRSLDHFSSYFSNVSEFPSEEYELELQSYVSPNQLVVVPVGAFTSFTNASPCCLGFYRFYNLAPIKSGVFRGLELRRVAFAGLGLKSLPMEALREQSSSLLKVDIFDVSTHNRRAIIPPRFDSFEALQTISIEDTTLLPLPNFSFCHLPALLHLKVSNVLLGDQGFPPSVFNDVPRLETLRLSRVGFTEIPAALTHLRTLKRLDLSDNEIENVEARVLSTLRGLQVLDLQGNRIEVLDGAVVATLENMTSLQAFRLDSDNPFLCTCELLPFLVWLHKSSIHIGKKSNFATYACKNPSQLSGARLLSPDLLSYLESNCSRDVTDEPSASPPNTTEESHGGKVADVSLSYQIIIPVAIVSVVLSAVGVVATWMLHKRLKRRWVGLFRRFDPNIVPRQVSNTPDQEIGYRYDAYICHHESATEFVVNEMMPEMEGEPGGFRLCLSFRDFLVGADKVDNVATAMKASRFVIVLLDGEFIACGQCMLELNMACTRTLEAGVCVVPAAPSSEAHHLLPDGATGLLLVLLEALPVEALPTTLRVLQDKITCLEWNREDTRRCWQQLKISLRNTTYYQSPQLESFDITQPLI